MNLLPDAMASLLSPFHIGHRHAYFYVCITIHELINVPLIAGDFGASWKMNKTSAVSPVRVAGAALSSAAHEVAALGTDEDEPGSAAEDEDKEQKMRLSHLLHGKSTAYTSDAKGVVPNAPVRAHRVHWDHKVEKHIRIGVDKVRAEDVGGLLHSTPFRLSVMQSLPESSVESESVLGTLTLNMAEYAPRLTQASGSGSSTSSLQSQSQSPSQSQSTPPPTNSRQDTRQYLLSESASNTLVRISVEMRFVGGTPSYVVPDVHGGITGLAGLLEPSDENKITDTMADSREQEPTRSSVQSRGIEWHSNMPLSHMQYLHAVPPEHIRVARRERRERRAPDDPDSPQLAPVDNGVLVRRILGMPTESESARSDNQSDDTHESLLARLRWGKLRQVFTATSRTPSDAEKRSPPRSRAEGILGLSKPHSPRHRRGSDSTASPASPFPRIHSDNLAD